MITFAILLIMQLSTEYNISFSFMYNIYYFTTNLQNQMSIIEESLAQLFGSIQKIAFQSQITSQKYSQIVSLTEQPHKQFCNLLNNSVNQQQTNLQLASKINFHPDLIDTLNHIWDGSYYGRSLKRLFNRNYHTQKRCSKQLEKNAKKQVFSPLAKQINWQRIQLNNDKTSIVIQFNGQDLESIKKGQIAPSIITNYIKLVQISKVINATSFIFPFDFFSNIIGSNENNSQLNLQQLKANITKSCTFLKDQMKVNILSFQYLLIPVLIQQNYKLIIVKGANNLTSRVNNYIILCNIKKDKCSKYIQVIRILLQNQMNKAHKKHKKIALKDYNFPTISLMLPRQLSSKDTGLYIMLYCEFLFARKEEEFQNLTQIQSNKKLHLFPRSIVSLSRPQIWNLFVKLIQQTNEENRGKFCLDFFKKRLRVCDNAVFELNYYKIEEQERRKYMILNNRTNKAKTNKLQVQLSYYLNADINYQHSIDE